MDPTNSARDYICTCARGNIRQREEEEKADNRTRTENIRKLGSGLFWTEDKDSKQTSGQSVLLVLPLYPSPPFYLRFLLPPRCLSTNNHPEPFKTMSCKLKLNLLLAPMNADIP